jgi:hypothetical protein
MKCRLSCEIPSVAYEMPDLVFEITIAVCEMPKMTSEIPVLLYEIPLKKNETIVILRHNSVFDITETQSKRTERNVKY